MPNYKELETGNGVEGVWIDPAPELVYGELKQWANAQGVSSVRLPGCASFIHFHISQADAE